MPVEKALEIYEKSYIDNSPVEQSVMNVIKMLEKIILSSLCPDKYKYSSLQG